MKNKILTSERDLRVLKFIWRFKVATTAQLYHAFFSDIRFNSAYNILQRLRRNGLIYLMLILFILCTHILDCQVVLHHILDIPNNLDIAYFLLLS